MTCDHKGQRAKEFDRERVSTFGHPQHIIIRCTVFIIIIQNNCIYA